MIRINQIKLPIDHTQGQLKNKIKKILKLRSDDFSYKILKKSIDARKKPELFYIYSVSVEIDNETHLVGRLHNPSVMLYKENRYSLPENGENFLNSRPVIVGAGPAGLFCAYILSLKGFAPIVIERGSRVDKRKRDVENFWNTGILVPDSNVQFGEGGAGTFSDGKLNTSVKDPGGRNNFVLETFVKFGAKSDILYDNKPHIGTDILADVIVNMRKELENNGTTFMFDTLADGFEISDGRICSVNASGQKINTDVCVLALGHSSRDTVEMLYKKGVPMEPKPFAMGLRIEHKRADIDVMKYGDDPAYAKLLPAADYKMTHQASNGRAVYSFCMCPGGYVVNASSEHGETCVNGMSYSGRDGENSNSAIVVNVTPEDYGSDHPLAGMKFQRRWEKAAYEAGQGAVPVQLFGDYRRDIPTEKLGGVKPQIKGKYRLTSLKCCLPEYIKDAIIEGVVSFDKRMPGYSSDDAVLSGIEARTSSPVRMIRGDELRCEGTCIYPCGEGAGYAGGITSAAVDGMKVAEAIASRFSNEAITDGTQENING